MGVEILVLIVIVVAGAALINEIENKKENRLCDISFKEALDLTDLPVITFYNNGKKINFLLDTGANNSVIDSTILDNYNYEKSDIVGTVTGMEGNSIETSYATMDLEYKELVFEDKFQCVDMSKAFGAIKQSSGVTIHGILGNVFFRKYRYILDFDELKAYIK